MNRALARKDLSGFMDAYKDTKVFHNQLAEIGFAYSEHHWMHMFNSLNREYFGNISTAILSNPKILEDVARECRGLDDEAKELAQELYRFNRNKRKDHGDRVDDENGSGHHIFHDDAGLALARDKNIHPNAAQRGESRYFVDGTYSEMWFSTPANLMVYTLLTSTHVTGSPLDSHVERCSIIDLGLDGIDKCDARLNGVGTDEASIRAANQRARECMAVTTKKLRQRYAGTGYLKK